ncbi:MAG TPA: hypothetical protein ENJ20_02710 [Bacteroidetes bacterium]|nr:hypothetical protein [Bacteroidota bacterium]
MSLFRFFKPEKPVGFTYRPRFYDEKKEAFQERLKEARERSGDDAEARKARIRRDLRRKSSYRSDRKLRQQQLLRSNLLLLLIIGVLIVLTYSLLELYLPLILKYFQ